MKILKPAAIDAAKAQDTLENAVNRSAALLETLAVLRLPMNDDFICLDVATLFGQHELALQEARALRAAFHEMIDTATQRKAMRNEPA